MTFWKKNNYGTSEKISGCQGLGDWERMNGQRIFRAVKKALDIIIKDTFVQTSGIHNTKSKP